MALISLFYEFHLYVCAGLSLTGGKDYKNQPYVKVDRIYPGGAVAEDGTLTVSNIQEWILIMYSMFMRITLPQGRSEVMFVRNLAAQSSFLQQKYYKSAHEAILVLLLCTEL